MWRNLLVLALACLLGPTLRAGTATVIVHNTSPGTIRDGSVQKDGNNFSGAGISYPLTAAGDYTGSITTSPITTATFRLRYQDANFIWYLSDESYSWDGNSAITMHFYAHGTNPGPPQDWKLDTKICNDTQGVQVYGVYVAGNYAGHSPPLLPGECFDFHYQDAAKKQIDFRRVSVDRDGNPVNSYQSVSITTSDSNWYQSGSSPGITSRSDDKTGVPKYSGSGTNHMTFNDAATSPATEDSLRRVGDALYDASVQNTVQSSISGSDISGKLTSLQNEIHSGFVNVNGQLVSVNSALATLNASASAIQSGISGVNVTVGAVKTSVDALGTKLDTANGSLSGIASGVSAGNTKLDTVHSDLGTVNVNLGAINTSVGQVRSALDLWRADQQLAVAELTDLNSTADGLAKESTLQLFRDANHSDLGAMSTKVQAVKDELHANAVDQGSRDQAQLNRLGDIEADARTIDTSINQAKTQAHGDSVDSQARLTTLHNDANDIKNALDGVYNAINGLANGVAQVHTDLNEVRDNTRATTNFLGAILTKLPKYLSDSAVNAETEGAAGEAFGQANGGSALAADGAASIRSHTVASAPADVFSFSIGGKPVDCNPLHAPMVAGIAAWVRYLVGWLAASWTVYMVYQAVFQSLLASGSWQTTKGLQTQTPIIGTLGTLATAIGYRSVIGLAIGALVVFWTTWKTTHVQIWELWTTGQPFGPGFGQIVTAGIALLDQVVPIATILTDMGIVLGSQIALGGVNLVRQMAVRWLPS